jgi:hypothetical protein
MSLNAASLRTRAEQAPAGPGCTTCGALSCPGWESLPAGFSSRDLRVLDTLRSDADERSWAEYHPAGTRLESADAPIAPGWHPYNRADLCACRACGRLFLRYTEGGGYYVDERVREVDPALIVEVPPPA